MLDNRELFDKLGKEELDRMPLEDRAAFYKACHLVAKVVKENKNLFGYRPVSRGVNKGDYLNHSFYLGDLLAELGCQADAVSGDLIQLENVVKKRLEDCKPIDHLLPELKTMREMFGVKK